MARELTDITVMVRHETDKAYLVDWGTGEEAWVPKSQCECEKTPDGKAWTLTLPQWLAEKKGMV